MSTNSDFEIQFFESVLAKSPDYTDVIEILGALYTQTGQFDNGLKMDKQLVKLLPSDPTAHYNLACSLAIKDRKSDAVKMLKKAIELGYRDLDWMREDPDLFELHDCPIFENLLEEFENSILKTGD
jgi:tetratricopeptide (TPR) repeat protein